MGLVCQSLSLHGIAQHATLLMPLFGKKFDKAWPRAPRDLEADLQVPRRLLPVLKWRRARRTGRQVKARLCGSSGVLYVAGGLGDRRLRGGKAR